MVPKWGSHLLAGGAQVGLPKGDIYLGGLPTDGTDPLGKCLQVDTELGDAH